VGRLESTGHESQRGRLLERLRRSSPLLIDTAQAIIAIGGLLIVIAVQIPWLDAPLRRVGFGDHLNVTLTIFTLLLVSIFYDVRALSGRRERKVAEQRHFADPLDVYPVLHDRLLAISRQDEKVLDVLGMTLYTAWPTIGFWLARPEMAGWTIRLAAVVDTRVDQSTVSLIPSEWFRESQQNLTNISTMAKSPNIRDRSITLEAYGYDFMPALHGFRLGNGDLFYSILLWQRDGRIGRNGYSYEFVPCEDHSQSAQATREIFDSWFARARRSPWQG
jgi:hypothetical protein